MCFQDSAAAAAAAAAAKEGGRREGKVAQLAEEKPMQGAQEGEKNYGAFKLIPKAPIGICFVLFFITFQ